MAKKLTKKDKVSLANYQNSAGLEAVDKQDLFMDSHGCMVVLVVVRREPPSEDGSLYGFTYRYSSEQFFYDEDPMEIVPLKSQEVVKVEYSRTDGEDWASHV